MKSKPHTIHLKLIRSGLLFLFVWTYFFQLSAGNKIDSLQNLFNQSKNDSVKFDLAARIYNQHIRKGSFDKAFKQIGILESLEKKISKPKFSSTCLQLKANYFYKTNKFDSAIFYDNKSIEIASKINYNLALIRCYVNLGNIYNYKSDYQKAINAFQKAELYASLDNDTLGKITTTLNIGSTYFYITDYKQAKINFKKVIKLCEGKNQYMVEMANAYNNLGTIYQNEIPRQYDSAMYYYERFKSIAEETEHLDHLALAHYNMGEVLRNQEKIDAALKNYKIAEDIYREEEDTLGLAKICLSLGDVYIYQKKYDAAIKTLKEGLSYTIEYETVSESAEFYKSLSTAYYQAGKYKESIDFYRMGVRLADSIYNADNSKILYDMQTKYETEEKEKQNKLLEAENIISTKTIKQQQLTTYFIIGGLVLTLLLAFFIFRGLRIQKKANAIISLQKEEVMQQKLIVEEHQKEILDSIHYAKRIQNTLLAHKDFVDQYLPNNFIYFNPKDIVSGDFYWATKKDNYFYFAVCDSTGHGVPGAFMSLLNIGFLSEAINEKNIVEPAAIFNYVRDRLVSSVSKDGQKDGFDGILLRLNLTTNELVYTAANNCPVLVSNGEMKHLKADKMPVGYGERKDEFTQHEINLNNGDTLYLYTDGYADQFGGPKGKKFKYKQLDEFLYTISSKPLNEQSDLLSKTFIDWKGNLEQIDDVVVVGIKLI